MHEHYQRDPALVCVVVEQVSQPRVEPRLIVLDDLGKVEILETQDQGVCAGRSAAHVTLELGFFIFESNLRWTVSEPVCCSKKDGNKASVQPTSTSRGSCKRSFLRRLSTLHSPSTSDTTRTELSQGGEASPTLPGSRSLVRSLYKVLYSYVSGLMARRESIAPTFGVQNTPYNGRHPVPS